VSLPNAHDRSTPSVLFLHAVAVLDEQHYKSGACVSDEREFAFGANGACEGVRAYEDDEPYVLPQH
tara:strand:- start:2686 stop:2883 length:198 start_codon:yes stop_codon:yes gene_type:complete